MKGFAFALAVFTAFYGCGSSSEDKKSSIDTASIIPGTTKEEAVQQMQEMQKMQQNVQDANIEVQPVQVEGGWGYNILLDGKKYVHQPHIPAVSGNKAFESETDARKAGELVAYKIRNNIMPPSVTVEELDSIGVLKK